MDCSCKHPACFQCFPQGAPSLLEALKDILKLAHPDHAKSAEDFKRRIDNAKAAIEKASIWESDEKEG